MHTVSWCRARPFYGPGPSRALAIGLVPSSLKDPLAQGPRIYLTSASEHVSCVLRHVLCPPTCSRRKDTRSRRSVRA